MGHVFETSIDYKVIDHASGPMAAIEHAAHAASHGFEHISEKIHEFGKDMLTSTAAQMGLVLGLDGLKDKVIEVGKEFEEIKESIAGTQFATAAWGKDVAPVDRMNVALAASTKIFDELEDVSYKYAVGLKDVSGAYEVLAITAGGAGISQKKLMDLTEQTAAAAKVYGADSRDAADLIGKAILTGTVRATGKFGEALKGANLHLQHLTAPQRVKALEKAIRGLEPAAEAMSQGLGDSMFRIQADVSKAIRTLTAGVFEELGSSKEGFAKSLHDLIGSPEGNAKLKEWSHLLVDGLHTAKDIVAGLLDHWKEIAVIYAGFKLGGLAGSAGGIAGSLGLEGLSAGFGKLSASLGPAVLGLTALYMAADAFAKWADKQQGKAIAEGAKTVAGGTIDTAIDQMQKGTAEGIRIAYKQLKSEGLATDGKVDETALATSLQYNSAMMEKLGKNLGMNATVLKNDLNVNPIQVAKEEAHMFAQALVAGLAKQPDLLTAKSPEAAADGKNALPERLKNQRPIAQFGDLHLTMDFKDADPDRVFTRFVDKVQGYAENRIHSALSEKFGPSNS